MKGVVTLVEGQRFEGRAGSGGAIAFDAEAAEGRGGAGVSPVEALLLAAAACSASDVVALLRKMRQPLKGLRVTAAGERAAEAPRVFTTLHLDYEIAGSIDPRAAARAIELSLGKYCTVGATVQRAGARVTSAYRIVPAP